MTSDDQDISANRHLIAKSLLTVMDFSIKGLTQQRNTIAIVSWRRCMSKIPITKSGFEKLKKDLELFKTVLLPENIKDIEIARAHGDLSENAEYAAAKERQSYIHGKIKEIENNLALSDVIELNGITPDKVVFGATVVIEDMNGGQETKYRLVGPLESDINENKISVTAPLGKAMIGKRIGDMIEVKTPGGLRKFEIVDITIEL